LTRYVGPREIVIDDNPAPVPFWAPDRSFQGRTVLLVGGGPSHVAFDLAQLEDVPFIAINSGCRHVRPMATADDILYFTDNSWAENRPELLRDWPGPVVTVNRNAKARLGAEVRRLDLDALTQTFQVRSDYVQASSGHIAACLATIMGARRIVLIGFECLQLDGRTHGHQDYSQDDPVSVYEQCFIPGWRALAPALERMGVEVVNATPISAIDVFPMMPLAQALGG
jgi:hypothetical protein